MTTGGAESGPVPGSQPPPGGHRWIPPESPSDWQPPTSAEWTPPWSRSSHRAPDDDGETAPIPPVDESTGPIRPPRQREALAQARRAAGASRRGSTAAARATRARIRRATNAEGAGESGLAKLIELHAVNAIGDVLIAVSLAGTLFFSVPTGEARGNVALYLLVTMAPFAVVAPVIGPVLDRFRHGRRGAIAGSFAVRAFLAWVLADAVARGGIELYPAAFGVLVASKAYVVTRSTTVPRLLPPGVALVKANAKVSLAGVVGVAVGTPIAVGLAWLGPQWSLRFAFVVFVVGTILSAMLPRVVDSAVGEVDANVLGVDVPSTTRRLGNVGAAVVMGLRVNAAIRATSGFLTIFLLFLVRDQPVGGLSSELSVALVGVSAIAGSTLGSIVGSRVRDRAPEPIIMTILAVAALAGIVAALFYGTVTLALVAVVAGLGQQLGKLSLDAQIQRDVPEEVRSSAFARAETAIQLAWVLGGGLGILLPLDATLGMSVVAVGLLIAMAAVSRSYRALRRSVASPVVEPGAVGGG